MNGDLPEIIETHGVAPGEAFVLSSLDDWLRHWQHPLVVEQPDPRSIVRLTGI